MDELSNTNDISSIIGMAGLFNNAEIDNSIKPKHVEKELIQNTLELDTYSNDELLNYNPINEYNSVFESLLETPQSENNLHYDTSSRVTINVNENDDDVNLHDTKEDSEKNDSDDNDSNSDKYDSSSFAYKLTEEQQNQKFVDNVLNTSSYSNSNNNNNNYNYNIEDENREDLKLTLLEKIDNLTEELEDEGMSLDKIPKVDYTSNLDQIEYVAKLLMLKANRNRYASLGEEFILALASGLEMLCNGDREFLGIRPDLNGYSDVVKVKLRRLRNETSQVVGNVVEKYEISPVTTLLIELIPSLFLHSKRRKNQSYDNLYNDLSDDINEISKFK